ncbi:TrbI/VirB10 family protein, partial [Sphingobium sp.]|uniref:TrbI/VirB10 family protein n=1 Tax=Sphingobium sp. TaxID=1912891 RepID=UPI0035C740EB
MAMDAKQRKTLMIRIGAAVAIVILLGFFGWMLFGPSGDVAPKQTQLSPSDPMVPEAPSEDAASTTPLNPVGTLSANVSTIQFQQDKPDTIVFTLQALGGPVGIVGAEIPSIDSDVLKVANIDCPVVPQQGQLGANMSCTASVTWNGARSVNSTLTIRTGSSGNAAVPTAAPTAIPAPDATAAPAAAGGQSITIPITAVSTKPAATGTPAAQEVPPPAPGAQAPAPQAAVGMSPMQLAREAYLAARRGMGFSVANGPSGLQPAARSPYTSWDNIGVQSVKSSAPTDMSRVITPDKPMTAVLTYQIDTRQTVTAVATVDRDVYGSSGRTVVIPRGTKIIGRVGGGATDRVGIAWNQLIRPDGVRFVFDGESGDAMGRGGVPGRINNRYLQRYGFSLLPNIASAGVTALLGGQSSTAAGTTGTVQSQDAKAVAAQILQQPLQQIANDLFQKNGNIPVQITVPAGTRITVWSTGDLRLKPAGEEEPAKETGDNRSQQGGGFGQNAGRQGGERFNPYAVQQQGGGGSAPAPQIQGSNNSGGGAENGGASLQVGRVDANGNYIAPGATAPAPPPIVTNTNNGAARAAQQQRGTTMPT